MVRTAVEERGECEGGFVLTLRAGAQILSDVQTLVDAEKTCCRWIDFELPQGDRLTLRITARSPEGVAVIKEMLGL
ncbi:MAG TPA: hypothetical protein VGZ02_10670 [Candidatus Baltobacteraceae bacterium]|nr:hypothetical protein [Candidatus Baltobacteraceae bacterium]